MLVDTNVLIDVLENDPDWSSWSVAQLQAQSKLHKLVINPVIYAELSVVFKTMEKLDKTLHGMELSVDAIPRPALFLAGKAFLRYRQRGGTKKSVLADFFIGAHAAVAGFSIVTRDPRRYVDYFPTVELITPSSH